MSGVCGLDAWLTREPPEPMTEPHAPWVPVWVSVEGDHWDRPMEGKRGWWGVEHGGDVDGETTFVAFGHTEETARLSCDRMNALYAYDRERDRTEPSGSCRVCGDFHEDEPWMLERGGE